MNITRVTELQKEIRQIKDKFKDNGAFSSDELSEWSAQTVLTFEEIGVPNKIIDDFISLFNIVRLNSDEISPFLRVIGNSRFIYNKALYERLMPLHIAIEYAEIKLKNLEFEDALVPRWLLKALETNKELSHIFSSLTAINNAYQSKSPDGLLSHSTTLLDQILNLEPDLQGKDIGQKLQILCEKNDVSFRYKFGGLSCDFFRGLNNSRISRNTRVTHPAKKMKHDIPFIVGLSASYLVITLLESTLASGELI